MVHSEVIIHGGYKNDWEEHGKPYYIDSTDEDDPIVKAYNNLTVCKIVKRRLRAFKYIYTIEIPGYGQTDISNCWELKLVERYNDEI